VSLTAVTPCRRMRALEKIMRPLRGSMHSAPRSYGRAPS
jgi:hypothetical protein